MNATIILFLFFSLKVFGFQGNLLQEQPNLCGYANVNEFLNLIREEAWIQELEKLMPEQMASMMRSVRKVELKVRDLPVEDTTAIIEIPELFQQLLKIREKAALMSGEKREAGKKIVKHADLIIEKVNK